MHSFRGFKELHLNLKIVPDLFFHCNFINPFIIFETIFGKWIRLPACKALADKKKPQTRVFRISAEERLFKDAEQFHQHFVTIR